MQQGLLGFDGMQCLGKLVGGGAHRMVGRTATHKSGRASQVAVAQRSGARQTQAMNDIQAMKFSVTQSSHVVAAGPAAVGSLQSAVPVGTSQHASAGAFVGHALHNSPLNRTRYGAAAWPRNRGRSSSAARPGSRACAGRLAPR